MILEIFASASQSNLQVVSNPRLSLQRLTADLSDEDIESKCSIDNSIFSFSENNSLTFPFNIELSDGPYLHPPPHLPQPIHHTDQLIFQGADCSHIWITHRVV